jgi:hypothetical protein
MGTRREQFKNGRRDFRASAPAELDPGSDESLYFGEGNRARPRRVDQ